MNCRNIAVVAATVLTLAACSSSSGQAATSSTTHSAPVAAPGGFNPDVPARNLQYVKQVSSRGFSAVFPVLPRVTKVHVANPCTIPDPYDAKTVPSGGCPYLGSDGYAMYVQLFQDQNIPGYYCAIDPPGGIWDNSENCPEYNHVVYEVDVFQIPHGAEQFALRWIHAVYGCTIWIPGVQVGNTRGAECDQGMHGEYPIYLVMHHGKMIVVAAGEASRLSDKFRQDFRLAA